MIELDEKSIRGIVGRPRALDLLGDRDLAAAPTALPCLLVGLIDKLRSLLVTSVVGLPSASMSSSDLSIARTLSLNCCM